MYALYVDLSLYDYYFKTYVYMYDRYFTIRFYSLAYFQGLCMRSTKAFIFLKKFSNKNVHFTVVFFAFTVIPKILWLCSSDDILTVKNIPIMIAIFAVQFKGVLRNGQ